MTSRNEITIPYKLYKETVEKSQNAPRFLITHANYQGVAESLEIKMQCDFNIKVFDNSALENKNVVIPLISQKATISNSSIVFGDTDLDSGACIVSNMSPFYQFYTSKPGVYRVTITCYVPYLTVKKTGMDLGIPASSNNSISFQVPQSNANIKIFNSFADADATNQWLERAGKEVPNYTIAFAKLPLESQLRIQWTIKTDALPSSSKAIDTKIKPPSIVVVQNTLGSIGEGLLLLTSKFKYRMVNGSMSLFNLLVDKNLNIINVEGEAVKKWEVNKEVEEKSGYRNLSVWLDYGVENDYELTVSAEYNMGSTSADVRIPSIRCIGEEITRHRGFIAIEARTNVEISELESQTLDVIDIKELPTELSQLSQFPILLAYKFLDPSFKLDLRVKKNLDVQVLASICESAHFISTVSNTGKTIHQYILSIKNTQKQFVRLQVPFDYTLWSTVLDGQPIRPSCIENALSPDSPTLLVPLLKSGSSKNTDSSIQIEVVLLENRVRNISAKQGNLRFMMPKMDLPLRAAYCTVYLPENVKKTKKSEGNLKDTPYHSNAVPYSFESPVGDDDDDIASKNSYTNRRASLSLRDSVSLGSSDEDLNYYSNNNNNNNNNKMKDTSNFFSKSKARKSGGGRCGVIPVRVQMPVTSNPFYFEQILLDGEKDLYFEFEYKSQTIKVRRAN